MASIWFDLLDKHVRIRREHDCEKNDSGEGE
jgi:hypothetical protein